MTVDGSATIGTVSFDGTTVTYDPNGQFEYLAVGETTTDSFSYNVSDGNGGTDTATVTVTLKGVNDVPVAVDDTTTTNEDSPIAIATSELLNNDSDVDARDVLTIIGVDDSGTKGTVTLAANTITYNPNKQFDYLAVGESTTDSFSYTVSDGNGGTDTATVTVTLKGVNDVPVAVDDTTTTDEDSSIAIATFELLSNDSDVDARDVLTVIGVDDSGTKGTVTLAANTITYNPNGQFDYLAVGESTTDSFSYTISDGNGGTDTATVTVTIDGVNDVPTVRVIMAEAASTQYSDYLGTWNFYARDAEGDALSGKLKLGSGTEVMLTTATEGSLIANISPDAGSLAGGPSFNYIGFSGGEHHWTLTGVADLAPDSYSVDFKASDASLTSDSAKDSGSVPTLTVHPEEATPINYSGPLFVTTPSKNESNATIPLQALLVDHADNERGDITQAKVLFFEEYSSTTINSLPGVAVTQTIDSQNGLATYEWTTSLTGNDVSESYTIAVQGSDYYTGKSDYAVVTLSLPDGEFVTGGGTVAHKDTLNPVGYVGILGAEADSLINFGFNTKYNKKNTNLQGKATIIIRGQFDEDPQLDHYQIKSNATDSLSVFGNDSERATFLAKANLYDLDADVSLGGNLQLRAEVYDADKTLGTTDVDQFGINLTDSSGTLLFATSLSNYGLVNMSGGNVVIH